MTNIDELKSTGLKATLPRLKILEIFQKGAQRHMTAEDVFRVLLEERSDIGLATVYRVLTQFEQAGILIRSNFESGKAVYELDEGQHHDISCARRAARWKSSTTPRSKSASRSLPRPRAGWCRTTRWPCMASAPTAPPNEAPPEALRAFPLKGDAAGAAGRPLRGRRRLGRDGLLGLWIARTQLPGTVAEPVARPADQPPVSRSMARRCRSTNS